jgi:hypothetical protein
MVSGELLPLSIEQNPEDQEQKSPKPEERVVVGVRKSGDLIEIKLNTEADEENPYSF